MRGTRRTTTTDGLSDENCSSVLRSRRKYGRSAQTTSSNTKRRNTDIIAALLQCLLLGSRCRRETWEDEESCDKEDSPESDLDQGHRGYMVYLMSTGPTGHHRNTKTFLNPGRMFFSLRAVFIQDSLTIKYRLTKASRPKWQHNDVERNDRKTTFADVERRQQTESDEGKQGTPLTLGHDAVCVCVNTEEL